MAQIVGWDLWNGTSSPMSLVSIGNESIGRYDVDILTDAIVDRIQRKDDDPLFMFASYFVPHDPWQVQCMITV